MLNKCSFECLCTKLKKKKKNVPQGFLEQVLHETSNGFLRGTNQRTLDKPKMEDDDDDVVNSVAGDEDHLHYGDVNVF